MSETVAPGLIVTVPDATTWSDAVLLTSRKKSDPVKNVKSTTFKVPIELPGETVPLEITFPKVPELDNVAPLATFIVEAVGKDPSTFNVPALTLMVPLNGFAPLTVHVPVPCFVRVLLPLMAPANIVELDVPKVRGFTPKTTALPATPLKSPIITAPPAEERSS